MDIESNFDFLIEHSQLLAQLAKTAEASFVSDPNTTMVKLRQLTEALAKDIAARVGIDVDDHDYMETEDPQIKEDDHSSNGYLDMSQAQTARKY